MIGVSITCQAILDRAANENPDYDFIKEHGYFIEVLLHDAFIAGMKYTISALEDSLVKERQ